MNTKTIVRLHPDLSYSYYGGPLSEAEAKKWMREHLTEEANKIARWLADEDNWEVTAWRGQERVELPDEEN